jgi:hypothetical protein
MSNRLNVGDVVSYEGHRAKITEVLYNIEFENTIPSGESELSSLFVISGLLKVRKIN